MTAANESAPCRLCRKPMIAPHGGTQDLCPWCHAGDCRYDPTHVMNKATEAILYQHYRDVNHRR